ncbi:hypothetical protein DPMN_166656 [Dreissena polymorpha]|uniref:VWFA domain-containing protein n=1 Tax=Dreissena polymorpha TaxID=45954 RepID=A0A9D4IUC6_DREPO|nr:hypothetical protein DPMN_166656 [Dreissena polymorpha]
MIACVIFRMLIILQVLNVFSACSGIDDFFSEYDPNDCSLFLIPASFHISYNYWEPSSEWSECVCGSTNRTRQMKHCNSGTCTYCNRYEKCKSCYNDGTLTPSGCNCTERYYEKCCENRISICEAVPADVVFVLDSSLSQTEVQFNKQLDFVARFIDAVNVSETEFQFAVVTFSTVAVTELDFDSSLSKNDLKTQIKKISFRPGATFTDKGLSMARSLLSTRGNRLDGLSIVKFAFILTDGMSINKRATKDAASNLRREASVVAIGVGHDILHSELQSIASPSDKHSLSYVYSVENFDALHTMIDRLIDATCERCEVSNMTDIFVVIDDLSGSALTAEEFQTALNALTCIVQHLSAYGQPNGQTVNITTIDDLGYKLTSLSNASDLDILLISIQNIRQRKSCYTNDCDKPIELNISSGLIPIIKRVTDNHIDTRSNSRKILIVFSSGRFADKYMVRLELQDTLNKSNIDIFAIGPGYGTDIDGLHSLVREP